MIENQHNHIEKIIDITPIPTEYNGIVFRSRLESRWAKFFDIFNIPYEYEPEGFQEGDKQYLPDFYLPTIWLRNFSQGVWIEIKPEDYNSTYDQYKWGVMENKNFVVCYGNPPPSKDSDCCHQIYPWWDNYMRLMKCSKCGFTKFDYNEGNYKYCKNNQDHIFYDLTNFFGNCHSDNRIFNYNKCTGFL